MKKIPLNKFVFVLYIILKIVNTSILPNDITSNRTAISVTSFAKLYSGHETFVSSKSFTIKSAYLSSKPCHSRHCGK